MGGEESLLGAGDAFNSGHGMAQLDQGLGEEEGEHRLIVGAVDRLWVAEVAGNVIEQLRCGHRLRDVTNPAPSILRALQPVGESYTTKLGMRIKPAAVGASV